MRKSANPQQVVQGTELPRSNYLMFEHFPVLNERQTFYDNKKKIVKALTFNDITRCLDSNEAKVMLNDTLGEQEMRKILEKKFQGKIDSLEYHNYRPEKIVDELIYMP